MSSFPAGRPWQRMSVGLLVGLVIPCQVSCAGPEGSSRILSTSPSVIHTQTSHALPIIPITPEPSQKFRAVTALTVAPHDVPAQNELNAWIQNLRQRGITLVLIDIGTGMGSNRMVSEDSRRSAGIYFRSQWADTIRDVFGELVTPAHQQGLSVFAVVSPRRINWVDPALGWHDRSYDPVHRGLKHSPYLDLFHPAFQEYLVGLLTDLADTGIDGILFRDDTSFGAYDGFSAFGLRAFERDFQIRIDPARIFVDASPPRQSVTSSDGMPRYPPEFWRWTGWKARERVKILERLGRAMRLHGMTLQLALEIHAEAVTDPRAALVRYSEDLLEAKRRFQYFLIQPSSPIQMTGANGHQTSVLIEQMKGLLGSAERVWMTVPVSSAETDPLHISPQEDRAGLGQDIGLIYRRN